MAIEAVKPDPPKPLKTQAGNVKAAPLTESAISLTTKVKIQNSEATIPAEIVNVEESVTVKK